MPDNPRIEELRRRIQADPTSLAFAALAEEYRRAGRYQEAVDTCRAGLKHHPTYLSARVTLGRALVELNRLDEAQAELEAVLRTAPENLAAIRALAEIHHRRGEVPEALEFYRTAIDLARHDAHVHEAIEQLGREVPPSRRLAGQDASSSGQLPPAAPSAGAPSAAAAARSTARSALAERQAAVLERFLRAILQARAAAGGSGGSAAPPGAR